MAVLFQTPDLISFYDFFFIFHTDPISLTPRAQQRKLEEVRTRIAEQEKCMMSQRQRLENKKQYDHQYLKIMEFFSAVSLKYNI